MATQVKSRLEYKANAFTSEPLHFRRKDKKTKTKKVQRRVKLKFRHIFFSFLLVCGLFALFQRSYLFLISWDKLNVDRIEVSCPKDQIAEDIRVFLEGKHLGNLLILNINALKEKLMVHPWIKDIHVRKNFPSTLKIAIEDRHPAALMQKSHVWLIDRDGVALQKVDSSYTWNLPIFVDSKKFEANIDEKLGLGWALLDSLDPPEREEIAAVDLTEYKNAKIKLKGSATWIIIGEGQFQERLKLYRVQKSLFSIYGPLEYVDLRFEERIYIKPQNLIANDISPSLIKEAN
jgi:cell division septal protein FtsQ